MKIADHLSKEQRKQLNKLKHPSKKKRKKKPSCRECKSRHIKFDMRYGTKIKKCLDCGFVVELPPPKKKQEKVNWIEIMGMNRDRFGRGPGGALRRK